MTGRVGDLTTLATVKAWRDPAVVSGTDDSQLQREITACSKFLTNELQRSLVTKSYVEFRNGLGNYQMMLKARPIVTVTGVTVGQTSIPPVTSLVSSGFTFDAEPDPIRSTGLLYLRGYEFCWGTQNVQINYVAGLLVPSEAQTVPATPYKLACSALAQLWAADYKVVYASSGVALTPVASAPATGQYVPPAGPDDGYQFAAGDAGAAILVSYSYTPRDLEAACVTMVILEYNRRKRIGETQQGLAGETVTYYTQASMTPSIKDMIRNYRDVVPVMT